MAEAEIRELKGEMCPFCHTKNLILSESEMDVPYLGKLFIFGMNCSNCKYKKADVEAATQQEPCRWTLEITTKEDLNARVVRSSEATIKIPYMGSIEPGAASEGFITNVEGVLDRIKQHVEHLRDAAEEDEDRKKAKNLLKKIQKIKWGEETMKLIIEDPTGNSAIVSEKAKKEKL